MDSCLQLDVEFFCFMLTRKNANKSILYVTCANIEKVIPFDNEKGGFDVFRKSNTHILI